MTNRECLSQMVTKHGVDAVLTLLSDYMEEQAEQHEDTGNTGDQYDRIATVIFKAAREVRGILAKP